MLSSAKTLPLTSPSSADTVMPVNALPSIAGKAPVNVVAFSVPLTLSTNTVESAATISIDCVEPAGNTELVIALSTSVFV